MSGQFILGQYVRIIGRPELLTIGQKTTRKAKTGGAYG